MNTRFWSPPRHCALASDEVHVWRLALDGEGASEGRYWQTLSAEERVRAERFHFARDRRRFVTTRGVLRAILGFYLQTPASRIEFRYGPQGKPGLRDDGELRFNLAHSDGLSLFAFAWGREVGIDVERIRADVELMAIAKSFFTPCEAAALGALPIEERAAAFFRCWTRKEAYLKATGQGLSAPLDRFEVAFEPGRQAALLRVEWDESEARRWSLWNLDAHPAYAAALAAEGPPFRLRVWRW